MALEAILQQLHRISVDGAEAEGMTQRIQLLADKPKLDLFWDEAMSYLTLHRQTPDAETPDIFDPASYPFHPQATNAMPFLNWDVIFEIGVKVGLWKSPYATGFVDHSKARSFAESIARTSWILSPVDTKTPEHAIVDSVRYRSGRSHSIDNAELLAAAAAATSPQQHDKRSNAESRASQGQGKMAKYNESPNNPPLRYLFEVDIGVAIALENEHHSLQLKCGAPNIASILNGQSYLQNTTTTLLEFMAVYHYQRRVILEEHFKVPSNTVIGIPRVRIRDGLKVAASGKDVLQQASFARHAATLVHQQVLLIYSFSFFLFWLKASPQFELFLFFACDCRSYANRTVCRV